MCGGHRRRARAAVSGHRTEILRVRLTPAELAEVERRAAEAGAEVADWVRLRLLGDRVEPDGRALRWLRADDVREAIAEVSDRED